MNNAKCLAKNIDNKAIDCHDVFENIYIDDDFLNERNQPAIQECEILFDENFDYHELNKFLTSLKS
ncbi:hypothetical protein [Moraxella lacunata]|uniref:Uncharacterized protein n=1 Tax=Moraxella lacunata TaxID=477 RepID=A0A1V4H3G3_MORLA|nr:hypothetical protein [Moraxella lacunata]OPH38926.1 hypothetical protein B5J94_01960 [Moraxella lacunata]